MSMGMMRTGKRFAWLLGIAALLMVVLGGYGYYRYRYADLDTLATVVSDLPATVPASEVVTPDYSRVPILDRDYAVPGHYTIIEYRQKGCPECARLDRDLERFLALRKDVAVRKIDLAAHWSDQTTLRDFHRRVWFTPFVVIYGADGKQIRADDGGKRRAAYLLYDWLKSEFAKGPTTSG